MSGVKSLHLISQSRETPFLIIVIMFVLLHSVTSNSSFDSCRKEALFKTLPFHDIMFTQDVLFEVAAVSQTACGVKCVGTQGCVMFTFQHSQTGASGRCQVYRQVHSLTDDQEVSSGARSYAIDTTAPGPCPSGYSLACCCCLRVGNEFRNYNEAIERCRQMDQGQLVLTKTVDDLESVANFGERKIGFSWMWVGAEDLAKQGEHTWTDGTPLPDDSALWAPGQPLHKHAAGDCVFLVTTEGRLFDKYPCHKDNFFLCQKYL